jgi:hypothetical protein
VKLPVRVIRGASKSKSGSSLWILFGYSLRILSEILSEILSTIK